MVRILTAIPILMGVLFANPQGHVSGHAGGNAGCRDGGRGGMMGGMHIRMLLSSQGVEELGLTEDQQDKIKDLEQTHQEQTLEMKQKIEREQLALSQLMDEDDPSQSKIKSKIREISTLRTDLQLAQVDFFFNVRGVLTDEQIEQLETLRPIGCPGVGNPGSRPGPGMQAPSQAPPQDNE